MIIHNTLGQVDQEFKPLHHGRVNVFVCGPTVYDDSHIGHARTNIFFDVIVKYLRTRGYSVFYLQNITDIDDKIIKRGQEEGIPYNQVANKYFKEYLSVMNLLRVNSINYYALASLYIDEIISQIKRMIEKGVAYETADGIYFSVNKFVDYGKLSNQNTSQIIANARGTINEEKKSPEDFVLWKKKKPGEPFWDSPWGEGRPGWHIEDTAITEAWFGSEYDIHGGGSDLIFPHHEAEIAQMRSISGKKYLARYWIHTGMVNINNEKMSKSLKNFIKTRDLLKDYLPEYIRFALINSNYNTIIDFSKELMEDARYNVDKINILYGKLGSINSENGSFHINSNKKIDELDKIMENNFDTRSLIKNLLAFISEVNKNLGNLDKQAARNAMNVIEHVNSYLDILYSHSENGHLINLLLELRKRLRVEKNYKMADYIRAELESAGIYIEDNGERTDWLEKH
ncbi:MAG: cysteine--tRNA ligase [Ferroplasma sp.]